jgi:diacylglycerol kinase family enzyme
MDVTLIVNPFSTNVTEQRVREVEAVLAPSRTVLTEHAGHATELATAAAGVDAIVVFGGDGSANEVLNGLAGDSAVGFLPGGGTSVLARALGLPRDPVGAARQVAEALAGERMRRISLGRVNGRRFTFSAGVGLDAELVRRVDERGRDEEHARAGDLWFALAAGKLLFERRGRLEPVLEVEGHGRAAFALVANADPYSYAGPLPLRIAPEARFELGLDLVAPRAVRPRVLARYAGYALFGRGQQRAEDIIYAHDADRIVVRCDEPQPLQADGEDLGDVSEAVFEAERDAVAVLV